MEISVEMGIELCVHFMGICSLKLQWKLIFQEKELWLKDSVDIYEGYFM